MANPSSATTSKGFKLFYEGNLINNDEMNDNWLLLDSLLGQGDNMIYEKLVYSAHSPIYQGQSFYTCVKSGTTLTPTETFQASQVIQLPSNVSYDFIKLCFAKSIEEPFDHIQQNQLTKDRAYIWTNQLSATNWGYAAMGMVEYKILPNLSIPITSIPSGKITTTWTGTNLPANAISVHLRTTTTQLILETYHSGTGYPSYPSSNGQSRCLVQFYVPEFYCEFYKLVDSLT